MTEKVVEAFRGLLESAIAMAPKVVTAIVLLVLAVIVAKIAEKVLRAVLTRVKFDKIAERAGLDTTLQRMGLRQELNHFLPRVVYFLLLFLLAKTTADALGIQAISDAFGAFFAYLPNIVSAMLLVIVASAIGPFAGEAVARAGAGAGLDFAPALGRMVTGLVFFILGIMAVAQLKIDTEIIQLVTAFGLAGFATAFGLSFGLGTRDVTRNIVAGFYARKLFEVGADLEIQGRRGTLEAITPTHTVLRVGDQVVRIANGTILDEISTQ